MTTITIMANAVHKNYVDGLTDAKVDLRARGVLPSNITINWDLTDYVAEQNLALRDASLSKSQMSMYFALDSWSAPRFINLLRPLDDFQQASPIEDFGGISKGLLTSYHVNGKTYGIPLAPVLDILFYDTTKFSSAGYPNGPQTFEDVLKGATVASGNSANGKPNYAMRFTGSLGDLNQWANIYGGQALNSDYNLGIQDPPMIKALTAAAALYAAKGLPPDFFNLTADEWLSLEQQDQVAAEIRGSGYYTQLNDPTQSRETGHLGVIAVPPSTTNSTKSVALASATWYAVIPKNAADPQAAWEVIRALASPSGELLMALNGNTPIRTSTIDNAEFQASLPKSVLTALKTTLATAVPSLPGFDQQASVSKIFQNEALQAIQGKISAADAMASAAAQIKPLLPTAG